MTRRGSARSRNGVGDFRQSDAGLRQARQDEEARAAMHSEWCWPVTTERSILFQAKRVNGRNRLEMVGRDNTHIHVRPRASQARARTMDVIGNAAAK